METKRGQLNPDITQKDIADVTDIGSLFHGITELEADISGWDVSNVKDMRLMFTDAKFNGDLSKWNISEVENISRFMKDIDSKSDFRKKYPPK